MDGEYDIYDAVCPVCGADIPPEEIEIDEWLDVAEAVCPCCGHGMSWML